MSNEVRKYRNPFFYPKFIFTKMLQQRRQQMDNPKLSLGVQDYIHPSLSISAQWLE